MPPKGTIRICEFNQTPSLTFTHLFRAKSRGLKNYFARNPTKFSIFSYSISPHGDVFRSTNRENGTDHRLEPIKVENLTESGGLSVLLKSSLDDYFYPIFPSAEWKVIFHQLARNIQFQLQFASTSSL